MRRYPDTPYSVHRSKAQDYSEEPRRTIKNVIDVNVALWPEARLWDIEWHTVNNEIVVRVTFDGSCTCKDGLAEVMQERLQRMLLGKNIEVRANP